MLLTHLHTYFCRYLTQITDQILALFSDDESRHCDWNSDADYDEAELAHESEEENLDRLFSFEVSKTLEQEEDVTSRQGFTVCSPLLRGSTELTYVNSSKFLMTV
jgi:hypothetical protein